MARLRCVFRKPPHSAKLEVRGRAVPAVLQDGADQPRHALERDAREIGIVGHVAEDEVGMILQILSDAWQMMQALNAVFTERGRIAGA